MFDTKDIWTNAETACEDEGGYLASIGSAAENAVVASLITANAWIGLEGSVCSSYANPSCYGWVDGESMGYTNWNSKCPKKRKNHVAT